jgi:hypothetical protein
MIHTGNFIIHENENLATREQGTTTRSNKEQHGTPENNKGQQGTTTI